MHVFKYRYHGLLVPGAMILPWLVVVAFFLGVVYPSAPSTYWSIRITLGPVIASALLR